VKGFSIIVCTYNGSLRLPKLIEHLIQLETNGFNYEILIIDNNSNDNTFSVAHNLSLKYTSIRVFKEPSPGKSNAMICGFNLAHFEYLIICDDDNYLDQCYLINAFTILQDNHKVGIIGGKGILMSNIIIPSWFHLHENAWAIGKQNNLTGEIDEPFPSVWGAGMIIRKKAWDDLIEAGFNLFLTGKKANKVSMAGEDTELCILIKSIGYSIYFDHSLTYLHKLNETRISWKHLLMLKIGFTRSQVYFEFYKMYLTNKLGDNKAFKKNIVFQLNQSVKILFIGCKNINYYKSLFIAFYENREGYQIGIDKRNQFTRILELVRVLFKHKTIYRDFKSFKISKR
jgi:glycosyltransferase involved in cell wall biosynthesis